VLAEPTNRVRVLLAPSPTPSRYYRLVTPSQP
jgi:hypothetical protein